MAAGPAVTWVAAAAGPAVTWVAAAAGPAVTWVAADSAVGGCAPYCETDNR